MPVYDYQCQKCGAVIEQEHGLSEVPPKKKCGECKGKLVKIFSPPSIVFKGSGFYINDSKKKSGKPAATTTCKDSVKSGGECSAPAAACGGCSPAASE